MARRGWRPSASYCCHCGWTLTLAERRRNRWRCDLCTEDNHQRIEAWLEGAEDPTLDRSGVHVERAPTIH
jgi:hypothetical protein